ncbi:putative RNA binding protein YcfA (HicA-like mRNA interferase family) [Microvirga flocculans]|uniref:Putative RNA binding protein YcfA (HicA-like mRNA interferase family) n=1 Tax=Microvirga flocculans TaxID=217168 RepID=A0A7W6NA09_9HYPH|nr:type II toxin-antitoxin system HicA family toxin [Microvirga flocculans]MBB4042030.1 putative RNA binding protein YcfA (HicA-like mRNA interferase family) [Microvirga flocculans]
MPTVETNRAKIIRRLEQDGWTLARHGSEHDLYKNPGKPGVITVPRHRTVSPGVARSIAKAAGWI